jgi:hypothetical protein
MRASRWVLRSDRSFSAALGLMLSAGFRGGDTGHPLIRQPLSLSVLDQACQPLGLFNHYDGSTTCSLALAIAAC